MTTVKFTSLSLSFLFCLIAIWLLGCQQKASDYYPLFVGSLRVYEVYRTTIVGMDTVRQTLKQSNRVTGTAIHDYWDKVWTVRSQETKSPIATFYIRKTKSELSLIPALDDTTGVMKQLVFPLRVGNSWVVAVSPTDTLIGEVLSLERVKVPVGEFDSCYKIGISAKNADFRRHFWLAPNIGIVQNEIKSVSAQDKTSKTIWERSVLIQYNTKPEKEKKI